MSYIWEGFAEAVRLVVTLDGAVMSAAALSLWVSSLAVALAAAVGLPAGTLLGRCPFFGRDLLVLSSRTLMAVPTVFLGVVCFALFSRRGPLGPMELLYTPWAIVVGEFFLALPIIVSLTQGAIQSLDPRVAETAWTLGAGPLRRWITYLSEARTAVALAVLTAFARCVTELGIAMMVGGNIKGRTRNLATAAALETGKGEFGKGLAMGLLLLLIALVVTSLINRISLEARE
jgi:tungstate transport system permease protein